MPGTASDARQLQNAFERFNQQSSQLEHSYRELQDKVASLTSRLNDARSARLAELVKKERLSQRLSLLLDTLPGAIVVIDGDGVIREQNTEAAVLLNEPLSGYAWASIIRREMRHGGSEDGNIQLRDGRWLSIARRPFAQEPGEILLLADISDSRQMSEFRQRKERLRAIGEMTAEFAHQVRTPLASAMLYVSQLDTSTDAQRRVVGKIGERLDDLGRMVNDMLGFAAGGKRADQYVDVRALFRRVRSTLDAQLDDSTELSLSIDGTSIDRDARDTQPLVFPGNENALNGALINLITNARQACHGTARIELDAWRNHEWVHFAVTDNGPGIPEDVLPRLFEPFFTTRPQGTGLGLAVVLDVARAHGGDVRVESLEQGARFTMRLPCDAVRRSGAGRDGIGQDSVGNE